MLAQSHRRGSAVHKQILLVCIEPLEVLKLRNTESATSRK